MWSILFKFNWLFIELDSQGRLIDTDKWDNHNAIARGWKHVEDNYHPVTFRKIYGVEKQAPTPVPMMRQATPIKASTPAAAPQQVIPSEEPEAVSDLWSCSFMIIPAQPLNFNLWKCSRESKNYPLNNYYE